MHNRKLINRQNQLALEKRSDPNYVERDYGDLNGFVIQQQGPNRPTQCYYVYPKDYLFPRDVSDVPPTKAPAEYYEFTTMIQNRKTTQIEEESKSSRTASSEDDEEIIDDD